MTVGQLQKEITSAEFAEWMAFNKISPIGELRGDYRMASLSTLIANVNKSKKGQPYEIIDFMPDWLGDIKKQKEQANVDTMRALFRGE